MFFSLAPNVTGKCVVARRYVDAELKSRRPGAADPFVVKVTYSFRGRFILQVVGNVMSLRSTQPSVT